MIYECEDSKSGYGLMVMTGYKAGCVAQLLPSECLYSDCTISVDWIIKNWNHWIYMDCPVSQVLFLEGYSAEAPTLSGLTKEAIAKLWRWVFRCGIGAACIKNICQYPLDHEKGVLRSVKRLALSLITFPGYLFNRLFHRAGQSGGSKNSKYELLESCVIETHDGRPLRRIRAISDITAIGVKAGDLGGYIEGEHNLEVSGESWISGQAQVFGNASVSDNAQVFGQARVYDDARIYNHAQVFGNARVSGDAAVSGCGRVYGNARVCGSAEILSSAQVAGDAFIHGEAMIFGKAFIFGDAVIRGNATVSGDARICGDAKIFGDAEISVDARIEKGCHIGWFSIVGPNNDTITWYRSSKGINIKKSDFDGTLEEFYLGIDGKDNSREYKYLIEFVKTRSNSF
ncbi:hypothetical protein GCM10007207_09630 [Asaia siamensis]|uniref:Immunity protein 45 domain-containing protein n=2 Tax=Asaia siamensis TaxID=110479 RepID=A0ABQ1LN16_9PROT|nr:hypothetical protein AA0323_0985 [Asaia siamensis NRIC 0323]GGC26275.1 hypothetical protein GCM10007207_09630 [Asaia siamensis]